jgi:hypothetical protein
MDLQRVIQCGGFCGFVSKLCGGVHEWREILIWKPWGGPHPQPLSEGEGSYIVVGFLLIFVCFVFEFVRSLR